MVQKNEEKPEIYDFKEYHSAHKVCFKIFYNEELIDKMTDEDIEKSLKLTTTI